MSIGSVSAASQNFDTSITVLPPPTALEISEAQTKIDKLGVWDLKDPVPPEVVKVTKKAVLSNQFDGPITNDKADQIMVNLPNDKARKAFKKDFDAGKFSETTSKEEKLRMLAIVQKGSNNDLRNEANKNPTFSKYAYMLIGSEAVSSAKAGTASPVRIVSATNSKGNGSKLNIGG